MTKKLIIIAVISLVVGYLLGNFVPLQNFSGGNRCRQPEQQRGKTASIPRGKGILEVTVENSSNQPMVGIEIDVAVQPGPPEDWGTKEANVNGVANFELNPGSYYVYFNTSRFPSGYKIPPPQKVDVQEGQVESVRIVLEKD